MSGMTIDRITPDDVVKDGHGNIRVNMTGTMTGKQSEIHFFTSKAEHHELIKSQDVAPEQAKSGDLI
jgi:hypothetical protein